MFFFFKITILDGLGLTIPWNIWDFLKKQHVIFRYNE